MDGKMKEEIKEDIKQVMQENKDKLFCSQCNSILEECKEPMVMIKHYYCPTCEKDICGQAYAKGDDLR